MHKWTWSLTAVALLGLAPGCTKGGNESAQDKGVASVERGRMGENDRVAEQSPEVLGGEDLADQEIYGTVTGVAGNSVTVQDKGGTTMTLALDADTRFVSRGQQADRGQLQEGSQVRASYDELNGQYEATTVELFPKASSPQRK
ncbi:DUF5666 domain-containing protein [Archangium sp.]|uniref:DUF5666 domain-containing protein n=1 Tax=Archangium sp. TaxID=1872627 RepID=UPI002ED80129